MIVLGIESSCDETAAAVVATGKLLSNRVATQYDVHARFGGVVPELAARQHMQNIVPVIRAALDDAGMTLDDVQAIAATSAPGLMGSLLVGMSAAKALALARGIPFIGVNHLEGHLNAALLEQPNLPYPWAALIVSGGHTSLYAVRNFGDYRLLGATRDDAAGEAFDKVAKLLGLGYPGGPRIDRAAETGDPKRIHFSAPRFQSDTMDFSFSGFKTAAMHAVRNAGETAANDPQFIADVAASFQYAAVEVLVQRLFAAAERINAATVVLSGGVAANRALRARVQEECLARNLVCAIPSMALCTDNAAMIAYVGWRRLMLGETSPFTLAAHAQQELGIAAR